MASFHEVVFDPGVVEHMTTGGPMFKTNVVTVDSGIEQRAQVWQFGRGRWDIGERGIRSAGYAALRGFFRARKGRTFGFRWRDLSDYTCTTAEGTVGATGLGNGTAGPFQLFKNYGDAGGSDQRQIRKPVAGTVQVFKNGLLQATPANYTLDTTTGLVTFAGTLPTGSDVLTWSGQFDTPVRFDTDELKTRIEMVNYTGSTISEVGLYLMSVPIVEIIV